MQNSTLRIVLNLRQKYGGGENNKYFFSFSASYNYKINEKQNQNIFNSNHREMERGHARAETHKDTGF